MLRSELGGVEMDGGLRDGGGILGGYKPGRKWGSGPDLISVRQLGP